jgi:hypothetical protein
MPVIALTEGLEWGAIVGRSESSAHICRCCSRIGQTSLLSIVDWLEGSGPSYSAPVKSAFSWPAGRVHEVWCGVVAWVAD